MSGLSIQQTWGASNLGQVSTAGETERPALVQVISDPAAMMAEMAEELGFLVAEQGADRAEEAEDDERFGDLIEHLIRKALQAQKVNPAELKEQASQAKEALVREGASGAQAKLDEILRKAGGGSTQQSLAILEELVKQSKTDPQLQALGITDDMLREFVEANESAILSAINIQDVIENSPKIATESAQRILGLYENAVISSQSVLQTFQRLGQTEGISKISDWRSFLTEAVAADLSAQKSGGDKIQLALILQELKGFRLFNTLTAGLEKLSDRHLRGSSPEDRASMLQLTLDFVEQPVRELAKLERHSTPLALGKQILFFQDYRNVIKSMPDDAFASADQKRNAMSPLQKRIDELTYSEEELVDDDE